MIPLRDQIPTRSTPWVNYGLIAVNVAVFAIQLAQGPNLDQFVQTFALIPAQVMSGLTLHDASDVFTSMFMHAGLAHIGGNMLYLWIFGDNVEDALGHGAYLLFYLFGGVVAAFAHVVTNPNSVIPTVGASGAIAAVLGAYMVFYPRSRVLTLLILGYFIRMTAVPAVILLGFWFVLQFFQGVLSLGMGEMVGGVAFWAHIGGFVIGYALAWVLKRVLPEHPYGAGTW
jgi:membrane associated rhomboid family serine protease